MPISDIFGSIASGIGSFLSTRWSHDAARKAEDRAWQRETAYNHPSAQYQRLLDSPLNPALIYGTGTGSAVGNTHASVHNRQAFDLDDPLAKYYTYKSQRLNNDIAIRTAKNLDATNTLIYAQAAEARARAHAALRENDLLEGSFASSRDPAIFRIGGRVGASILNGANSISSEFIDGYNRLRSSTKSKFNSWRNSK